MIKKIYKEIGKDIWSLIFKSLIIIFGMTFYALQHTSMFSFLNGFIDPVVSSITVILIGFAWTQTISASFHRDDVKLQISSINDKISAINSGLEITVYENFENCRIYLNNQLEKAADVKNMCIVTAREDYRDYRLIYEDEIVNNVASVANRRSHWHDVFSNISVERSMRIRSKITANGFYHARKIKSDIPAINFIILDFGGNKKEVFFGFGLHEEDPAGSIYTSKNLLIVSTFEKYYESIIKYHSDAVP